MASKKISELDSITLAADDDLLLLVQDGANKNITKANLTGSYGNVVSGNKPVMFGIDQNSSGDGNVTIGAYQTVYGTSNVSVGASQNVGTSSHHTYRSVTIGFLNNNYNTESVVIGNYNINPYENNDKSVIVGNGNIASGINNVSFGIGNTSTSTYNTVLGSYSTSSGPSSIAIGTYANALGQGSTCIGNYCHATESGALAIGSYTGAKALAAIAIGIGSTYGSQSILIGGENNIPVGGSQAVIVGWDNDTVSVNDVAIGQGNISSYYAPYANANTGLGKNNSAKGYGNIAIGVGNGAYGIGAIAIGSGYTNIEGKPFRNYARGFLGGEEIPESDKYPTPYNSAPYASRTAIAIGQLNTAYGPGSISMGYKNEAVGFGSVAIGWENTAFLNYPFPQMANTAIGFFNISGGYLGSTAIGAYNIASYGPAGMTAIGFRNISIAPYATTVGGKNSASGINSTAIGYNNTALNEGSVAIGANCTASSNYTCAIGFGAQARVVNTTNIRGPIIIAKTDDSGGTVFGNYCGVQDVLMTEILDLTTSGNWQINIPSNASFYVDEVGVIANQIASVSAQPHISFDYSDTSGGLIATTVTSLTQLGDRNVFTPVLNKNAQTVLGVTVHTVATATNFTVRAYFKGILVENEG